MVPDHGIAKGRVLIITPQIIDEAHHSTASTWVECLQYFSHAKVVKLTGTPYRPDGEKIVG